VEFKAKCSYISEKTKEPCRAFAIKSDPRGLCFWHSPLTKQQRIESSRRGGSSKSGVIEQLSQLVKNPIMLNNVSDIVEFLKDTLIKVKTGQLDYRKASAVAKVADTLGKYLVEQNKGSIPEMPLPKILPDELRTVINSIPISERDKYKTKKQIALPAPVVKETEFREPEKPEQPIKPKTELILSEHTTKSVYGNLSKNRIRFGETTIDMSDIARDFKRERD
jgi:hypothetical protein